MTFLEKDLEQIIFETPKEKLQEKGLVIKGKLLRQIKIGNYGIADLISFERNTSIDKDIEYFWQSIRITVYELKQQKINLNAMAQAARYISGIQKYFETKNKLSNISFDIDYNIVLIGKDIEMNGDFVYLSDFINNVRLTTYSYDVDGIRFENNSGYFLRDTGF